MPRTTNRLCWPTEPPAALDSDDAPVLRFTPPAWAKLLYLRDAGPTEIGAFGITSADDLLRVEEIATVAQTASVASVAFDDAAVADFFDDQIDQSRRPEQFARMWIHTHPGDSADPSSVDKSTFARVFGRCDWSVMFILARGGDTYARLQFSVGPGGSLQIPVAIDYSRAFPGSDAANWQAEYERNVTPQRQPARIGRAERASALFDDHDLLTDDLNDPDDPSAITADYDPWEDMH